MLLDQFLNLTATILGAIGAVYVLKSVLRLTPELTERLSATFYGHNMHAVESFSSQKADSVVGASLVITALALAIVNAALGPAAAPLPGDRWKWIGLAVLLSLAVYVVLLVIGRCIEMRHREATAVIITSLHLQREVLKRNPIPAQEIPSLDYYGYSLLRLPKVANESPEELLRRIAAKVGHTLVEPISFEQERDNPSSS